MKVTEYIAKAKGKTLISFEILPPLKGGSMQTIFKGLDPLMEFKPPFCLLYTSDAADERSSVDLGGRRIFKKKRKKNKKNEIKKKKK